MGIAEPYLNQGGLKTDGIEIQVNWGWRVHNAAHGRIYLSSDIGYTAHYMVQTLAGSAFQDFAGTNTVGSSFPHWKALTTLGYKSDAFGLGLRWHYQAAMQDISAVLTPNAVQAGVPEYDLFDLFSTMTIAKKFEMRFGINNLFDKQPPVVSSSQNGADPSVFDFIGRQFYVGAKIKF
ncbi:MAG: TonB-dependent receptor [Alphaproteobacteria bacterium]|nr:TonB-dependent receptor [Alphaproteobacteria bacterium]